MSSTGGRLRLLVISVAAFLLLVQFVVLYRGMPDALRGKADFRSLYTAAVMIRTGHASEVYDHSSVQRFQDQLVGGESGALLFDRPAYEALFFVPLSLLPYRAAYIAFFVLNLASLGLAVALLRPYLSQLAEVWRWAPAAVFVCFFPVAAALIQGADSIILLTLLVASAVCFYRDLDVGAGVLLGFTLFGFQFALPIALLFLLWRRWRIAGGFVAVAAACAFLSAWVTGPGGLKTYAQLQPLMPASTIPNLRCLLDAMAAQHLSSHVVTLVWAVLSVLLILWAATKPANFALAILVAELVSNYGKITDAVVLVIPIAMVLDSRLAATSGRLRLWSRNVACLAFVAPALFFLTGIGYCGIGLLLLLLLMPLRSTSNSPPPNNAWFKSGFLAG